MASSRPTPCAPRSPAMSRWRGSGPGSRDRTLHPDGRGPAGVSMRSSTPTAISTKPTRPAPRSAAGQAPRTPAPSRRRSAALADVDKQKSTFTSVYGYTGRVHGLFAGDFCSLCESRLWAEGRGGGGQRGTCQGLCSGRISMHVVHAGVGAQQPSSTMAALTMSYAAETEMSRSSRTIVTAFSARPPRDVKAQASLPAVINCCGVRKVYLSCTACRTLIGRPTQARRAQ